MKKNSCALKNRTDEQKIQKNPEILAKKRAQRDLNRMKRNFLNRLDYDLAYDLAYYLAYYLTYDLAVYVHSMPCGALGSLALLFSVVPHALDHLRDHVSQQHILSIAGGDDRAAGLGLN